MKVTKDYLKKLIKEEIGAADNKNKPSCEDRFTAYKQAQADALAKPHEYYGYDEWLRKQAKEAGCKWAGGDPGAAAPYKAAQQKTPPPAAADKGGSLQKEIDDLKSAVKDVLTKLDEL